MAKKSPISDDALAAASLPACLANVKPDVRHLDAGDMLFRQGDKSFGMFRLATGRIRLLRTTPAGADMAMHTVRAGELFAEASLFSARYHCDAVVLQRSEVLVYPKAALQQALRQDPDALWAFAAELAQRVQGLRTRLELSRIRSAPERVLQALRLRCDAAGAWKPDATLKRFAEEIGLTHEALYRALALLEREGRIARHDEAISLR